jgi:hypothetical protein
MSATDGITISRGGQQYGPYTLDQIKEYLAAGNLVPTDLAWNGVTSAWVPVSSLLSGPFVAAPPPPPVARERNVVVLVLMAIVWWIVFWLVPFFLICFVAGMIAGALHPDNARQAGEAIGRIIGVTLGIPLFFVALGLSIWLTVIGKLPGTRK